MKREFLNEPWRKIASRRRLLLLILVLTPALVAASVMGALLPHRGTTILEASIIFVYCILFIWISLGLWTALAGFWTLLKKDDRFAVTRSRGELDAPIRPHVKTAILFPVCNEDPERIMAGIQAVWRSLARLGAADRFDIHILSDSSDPDRWVQEEAAWNSLCNELSAHGHIFYRRRRVNLKRKSGNVADFCRRYGAQYTYMIVFDADSVMSGETLIRMVRIMERRRNVGILQTAPACTGRETLIARAQQFANRAYGPMYAAGLHHWFLGDAQFWGHNAIIRVKPFIKHCALSRLPGKPPLGGDILSHDFVESALMRRAGYSVWLAYDLEGSYEEVPPNLLNELKRDRRWCQGNLQHLRLVFTSGIFPGHRALFLNGVMAYGSALLWFLFLALATAAAVSEALIQPDYFAPAKSLFPVWPVWDPTPALLLLAGTAMVLFLPKVCALLLALIKGRRKQFGGFFALCGSIMTEIVLSTLLAPVRMLFHSKYVFLTLLGMGIGWGTQQRDDEGTRFWDALRFHGGGTLLGLIWGVAMFQINRVFFWWSSPLVISLLLSIPVSMLTSRAELGRLYRKMRIFMTPEEVRLPREYEDINAYLNATAQDRTSFGLPPEEGFLRAAVIPAVNTLHRSLLRGPRTLAPVIEQRRDAILSKAMQHGPQALNKKEKKELLYDAERMKTLHEYIWELPQDVLEERWKVRLD
ncbi:MAG: glucans biosynthesis glucosyltransferase MdoH [Desulfomicrobium sp.]|nr:glucans biosynthesis glucosyltransferase MdoH [Pseudomonadota bacterium]MBV1710940.1 glucans biosynthesis glucosyltransferase MdoH [Desulfomicrobium sp.]MBU4570594.1 glucans biosynthesis glucosyltransferase MdoH [Pseudomonadota bacterium]MBU4593358.1 glucans biosynthesis glucosyltransferase MdoH [Pseudomonadota bacterium]MBV1719328.1 glucans biosynthesis glucosyltransferase MdoH [Desulfomicrobium sp.]